MTGGRSPYESQRGSTGVQEPDVIHNTAFGSGSADQGLLNSSRCGRLE